MRLDRFLVYAVIAAVIIGSTLLVLFGIVFLEQLVYPIFRRVAYMNVPEKEHYLETEKEPAFLDIELGVDLSGAEREEAKEQLKDEYRRRYGNEYEAYLRRDVKVARRQLGDESYEKVWGPVLSEYE